MATTTIGTSVDSEAVSLYVTRLTNKFFKVLPMIENKEDHIDVYIESLQAELIGCKELITAFNRDPLFISLLGVLQWIKMNAYDSECSFKRIRREVFHAISICKKLEAQYLTQGLEV